MCIHGWGLLLYFREIQGEGASAGYTETEIVGEFGVGGGNRYHFIAGSMRLSSVLSISLPLILNYFSFCCYPAIHLWYLGGWPFCSLNFVLLVAGTSPCFECSSLLFGLQTLHPGEHICQQNWPQHWEQTA